MFPFLYNSFLSPELIMLVFHLPSFLSTYYKFFPHFPPAQLKFNVNGFNLKVRDKIIYHLRTELESSDLRRMENILKPSSEKYSRKSTRVK